MKRVLIGLVLLVVVLGGWRIHARQAPAPLPGTQTLVLENALVRVLDIRVPPGVAEKRHTHGRGLTIALSDYENETRAYPGGQVNRGATRLGEVRWAEPVDHEARNTGATEQRVIRIELK